LEGSSTALAGATRGPVGWAVRLEVARLPNIAQFLSACA
jgi:hypothetical protein